MPLLSLFLTKSIEEHYNSSTETGSVTYPMFYENFIRGVSERNVDNIFKYCQSPIERIFLNSLVLLFIKNGLPCLHIMGPSDNVEEDMALYRKHHLSIMSFIQRYKDKTGDKELEYFDDALLDKKEKGILNDEQIEEVQIHNSIIQHFDWNSYHIVLQPKFPNIKVDNKSIRPDLLIWVPGDDEIRIIVECDGFAYHNSKDSFINDRIRDRQLQLNGYRVIRYSGSEINSNPIKVSGDLFDMLEALDKDTQGNRIL